MNYLVWALAALLYAPIFKLLYQSRWETIDYTHAYLVLPISLWLAWRQRDKLKTLAAAGMEQSAGPGRMTFSNSLYLPLLVLGLFMFFFGWRQEYLSISTLSMIPFIFGLCGYLYGPQVSRSLCFPILYLLLLVPPPLGVLDAITLPMRYWISVITHSLLDIFGYPVTRDGLTLTMGGKEIYMGAPCSGFRSVISMTFLSLAYVYVVKASIKTKIILLSSVVPLALLGNLVRVIGMCLVTFYLGEKVGQAYHDTSGYVIFLALIGSMLGLEWLLEHKKRGKDL